MKKLQLICILLVFTSTAMTQNRIARGYVLDDVTRAPIDSAIVAVYDTMIYTYTDVTGYFGIHTPKGRRHLDISHKDYETRRIMLGPGFQQRFTKIYLRSLQSTEKEKKKKWERDSTFLSYNNALTISLIELGAVAIAPRYERFLHINHSIGIHVSWYVYGHMAYDGLGFGGGYYPLSTNYRGIKLTPFYRYYPFRKKSIDLFIDAKIPFGYFDFYNLEYQYSSSNYRKLSISHDFWTYGFGISVGYMLKLPRTNHGMVNISMGYQYFPIVEGPPYLREEFPSSPGYPNTVLTHYTEYDWWYEFGPGAHFELKITFGGIF